MKDAKGHGSDGRGGQAVAAAWRASHQTGVMNKVPNLIRAFAKDESGAGHPPEAAKMLLHASHFLT